MAFLKVKRINKAKKRGYYFRVSEPKQQNPVRSGRRYKHGEEKWHAASNESGWVLWRLQQLSKKTHKTIAELRANPKIKEYLIRKKMQKFREIIDINSRQRAFHGKMFNNSESAVSALMKSNSLKKIDKILDFLKEHYEMTYDLIVQDKHFRKKVEELHALRKKRKK